MNGWVANGECKKLSLKTTAKKTVTFALFLTILFLARLYRLKYNGAIVLHDMRGVLLCQTPLNGQTAMSDCLVAIMLIIFLVVQV